MKDNTKLTLRCFGQAMREYWVSGLLLVCGVIGASIFATLVPVYFKNFFDLVAASSANPAWKEGLIGIIWWIALLEVMQWGFWRVATFAVTYFQTKVIALLHNQSFAYLHKHSFAFFDNNFVGTLVKRVKWFTHAFEVIADNVTWRLLPLVVRSVVIIYVLGRRNLYLAAGILLWVMLYLCVNYIFTKFKLKYDLARAQKESEATGLLADTITNNKSVKLFNGYRREVDGFGRSIEVHRRLQKFTWDLNNIFEGVQGGLMIVLEVGILLLAIRLWERGLLTPGDFVLIQFYLITLFMQLWDFGKVMRRIYEALADAEEMTIILKTPHEIQDKPQAQDLKVDRGEIEFQNVDFNYRQTRKVFQNFNLKIKSRERIALVGASGSGKTTAVKLLLRMHDLAGGKILIDGQDISQVTQESLWRAISMVPQDPVLFHRTLRENIIYGKPAATQEEILAAAQKARCHEFILELQDQYNTYVGERGIKLSGGERQRIAIARAILHNAPILVLDEATSSLDSEAEHYIQEAIDVLMKEKTVIVIAHRLSTIRKMDRIIVIDQGKIVEEGPHDILICKEKGIYKKLWEIQAGNFLA